jgi:hypothetical protein
MDAVIALQRPLSLPLFIILNEKSVNLVPDESDRLKTEITKMTSSITWSLNVKNKIRGYLPEILNLKIKILDWVIDEDIDYNAEIENITHLLSEQYEILKHSKKKEKVLLLENLVFSIDVAAKVWKSILSAYSSIADIVDEFNKFKNISKGITYEQLPDLLASQPIPKPIVKSLLRLYDVSLSLEITLILACIIIFEHKIVFRKRIITISRLIRNWTQEYGALALELGLWNPETGGVLDFSKTRISESDIKEEGELAEIGMKEYLEQIKKDEDNYGL